MPCPCVVAARAGFDFGEGWRVQGCVVHAFGKRGLFSWVWLTSAPSHAHAVSENSQSGGSERLIVRRVRV